MEDQKTELKTEAKTQVKAFWKSKTVWVNAIAVVSLLVQAKTGYVVDPDTQAWIITGVNFALRFVTKDAVSLT